MLEEGGGEGAGSSCGRKHQWGERSSFYPTDALFVQVPLGLFVASVARGGRGGCTVGGSIGIEYLHVKECSLQSASPEAICADVKACLVVSVVVDRRRNVSPVRGCRIGSR